MTIIQEYSRNNPGKVWRRYTYNLEKPADIAKYVARTKYAFPGGYELFAITDDGGILCFDCCRADFRLIAESMPRDGWHAVAVECTANTDAEIICDNCHNLIQRSDLTL